MRVWVLAVLLHGSILAAFVLFVLWINGRFDHVGGTSPPAVSAGVLPDVPALQVAPARAVAPDAQRPPTPGVLVGCWRGYRARRSVDADGRERIQWIQTATGRIPC